MAIIKFKKVVLSEEQIKFLELAIKRKLQYNEKSLKMHGELYFKERVIYSDVLQSLKEATDEQD